MLVASDYYTNDQNFEKLISYANLQYRTCIYIYRADLFLCGAEVIQTI